MADQAIIFDLDGTLWDASAQVVEAWNHALARQPDVHRQITVEEMQGLMGKIMTDIFAAVLPGLSTERQVQIAEECCREEDEYLLRRGAVLFPNVPETLKTLSRDYRLFIVSNCQDGYIEAFLGHYGFGPLFADTECFGRTNKLKKDNIRLLLERNKLEKAVYVGDTQLDFESAKYAGLPFIHAAYGYGTAAGAAHAIHTFSDLTAVVPQIL